MNIRFIIFLVVQILLTSGLRAQAVISGKEVMNGIEVYPDLKKKTVFYYAPGDLVLAKDNFGVPLYKFFQMRYTGSTATGDQGKINYRSILEFTINMTRTEASKLEDIRSSLKKRSGHEIELLPVPIKKVETVLVYALDVAGGKKEQASAIQGGNFEQSESDDNNSAGFWTERTFTMSLDNVSSQLLWNTLEKGQVIMSLCYAFYADGLPGSVPEITMNDSGGILADEIKTQLNQIVEETKTDTNAKSVLVKASATGLSVDIKKNSDRIKKIDVNENQVPPDYAVLDIRCYDFNNQLRSDLYAKRIEIIATGMDGREVKQKVTFYSSAPDIYYSGLRFKYAVKMDKPLKYRIVEIKNDTAPLYGNWIEQKSWNKLIDITSNKSNY
jgi:hypothetical protein